LDAKRAVAQAVGLFLPGKVKEERKCPTCARFSGLEGLDAQDLQLAIAGTSRARVNSMSACEFEGWAATLRAETEMCVAAARSLRDCRHERSPGSDDFGNGDRSG